MKPQLNFTRRCLLTLIALLMCGSFAQAATVTWNVAGSGAWDTTSNNWLGGVPDPNKFVTNDSAIFNNTAGGIITLANPTDPAAVTVSAASGTYTFTGGALATGTTITKSGAGTLVLENANTLTGATTVSGGTLRLDAGGSIATGNVNGALVATNGGKIIVNGGTFTASTAAASYTLTIAGAGAAFEMSSGTVDFTVGGRFALGYLAAGANSFTQTGGDFTLTSSSLVTLGHSANAPTTMNVSGGTWTLENAGSQTWLGSASGSASTLTVSNTGVVTLGTLLIFNPTSGTNTVTLGDGTNFFGGTSINDGGTSGVFAVSTVTFQNAARGIIEFNGGTLRARANQTNWLADSGTPTIADVNVLAGGGIIDNNDFNVTISKALQNGGGTDGGLVFKGDGTTTLTGANTYNGDTSILDGTLSINSAYLSDLADVYLTTGATFDLAFVGNDTIRSLYFDGIQQSTGTWGAVGSGADNESSFFSSAGLLNVTVQASSTPEPSTLVLGLLGLLGLASRRVVRHKTRR